MTLYHIDTDMGVDDGLALILADKLFSRSLAVSTVFGNVPVSVATRNALLFRELLGRNDTLPIFEGADRAVDGFFCDARHIHGEDGLGGATHRLDALLLKEVSRQTVVSLEDAKPPGGGSVVLIGIGPATNIPRLVSWYGRSAVSRIVLMSGAFFDVGNITPVAEFNAHCDPIALQATLELGVPTILVPLDVCRKVQLSRAAMNAFKDAGHSPISDLVASAHMHYMDFYREWEGIDGCFPHDSLAVLAALAPEEFFKLRGSIMIDVTLEGRGHTTFTTAPFSNVEIVTGGNLKRVREILACLLSKESWRLGQYKAKLQVGLGALTY
jgi:inosine-uridine nucleoside N-ribohydrolase